MQHIFFTTKRKGLKTLEDVKNYTESIYYELQQTAKFCKTLGVQLFEKIQLGITSEEYSILDTLMCNENICQRDLAKLILRDRANTGRILKSLERKKLIKRFVDIKNNRLVRKMEITNSGKNLWQEATTKIRPIIAECVEKVSRHEIENLRKSLKKMREKLSDMVEFQI